MIRIFHISDFHLNKDNLSDWKMYTKKALVEIINERQKDGHKSIIVCTGDLIDKGSDSEWGIEESFKKFRDEVIVPLVTDTGLSIDRFAIVPGNHDIDRKKDKSYEAKGLRMEFQEQKSPRINSFVNNVLDSGDYQAVKRMEAYKKFEADLYHGCENVKPSYFGTTFIYDDSGVKIGVAGYNSSWCAYDNNDHSEGLALGERQYNDCKNALEGADVKIALMHHPLDWLIFEKETIQSWTYQDYTIFCSGHVHESDTSLESKPYGTLFMDIAPSFTNDIRHTDQQGAFANGVTCIEYDELTKELSCYYYTFKMKSRNYILDVDKAENGCYTCNLRDNTSNAVKDIVERSLKYIKSNQYPIINNSLIPQKAKVLNSLIDAFVKPPIQRHGDSDNEDFSLQELLNNKSNLMFFGQHETGKTILLYRMLMEMTEGYHQYGLVPLYMDFLQLGNRELISLMRDGFDVNSDQAEILLREKKVILLVDNYCPTEDMKYEAQRLYNFCKDHDIRVIATCNTEMTSVIPLKFTNSPNKLGFENFHIKPFCSANIREYMEKWSSEKEYGKRMENMDKLVSSFTSYSLPCTPMSVSLYLWSRNDRKREPINKAVLLDIYISIILERLNPNNVYQNTFDYRNREMLLSHIAYKINQSDGRKLDHSDYEKCIKEYLKEVGFERFKADELGDYYLKQKIFVRRGDDVTFAHSCFFHFFLAKRMIDSKEFREEVLKPENFYKYSEVIGYYGGLVRNDRELMQKLYTQFENFFQPVQEFANLVGSYDDFFTNVVKDAPAYQPSASRVNVTRIQHNKPSEEVVIKQLDSINDKRLEKISDDLNKDVKKSPYLLLVMMSEALRNLDGVEDKALKTDVYKAIVRNTLLYTAITKNNLAIYANEHDGRLPQSLEFVTDAEKFLRYMPFGIQFSLAEILATTKLNIFFREKLSDDYKENVSDVEKYFSLAMLWDASNLENSKEMERFIRKVRKNIAMDYALAKLSYFYITRVSAGSETEKECLKLFATFQSRGYVIPALKRWQLMKKISK